MSISFILFFEKVSKSDRLRNKYRLYFMHALWKVMLGIVFNVDYNAYHFIECPLLSFQKGRLILRPRPSWPMLLKYMIMKWFFLLFIVEDIVLNFSTSEPRIFQRIVSIFEEQGQLKLWIITIFSFPPFLSS